MVRIIPFLNQIAYYYNSFAENQGLELAVTWELSGASRGDWKDDGDSGY
jgi:hypothetical protein